MDARRSDAASLERRPEAIAYQIDDLLVLLGEGRIRVPTFQRPLRWQDTDRVDLLDSLYRGFPIGTLLLWKHAAPAGPIQLGDFRRDVPHRADALWVVDGQQRLATLASCLRVPAELNQRSIHFILDTQTFRYERVRGPAPLQVPLELERGNVSATQPTTVPLHELFDEERLFQWLTAHASLTPELRGRVVDCGKRLRQYRMPAYVVDTGDVTEEEAEALLRDIFERTNRTGRRLDDVDAFGALFSTVRGDERFDLRRIVAAVRADSWGELSEKTALVALRAVNDLPVDRDFPDNFERSRAPAAIVRTEAGLLRAVAFLRDDAGVANAALNPYELPLVVLAKFFDRFEQPSLRNRRLLRRWVWRGTLGGTLGGASASLRQHVEAVGEDEATTVQDLLRLTSPAPNSTEAALGPFRMGTARGSAELCALASLEPRHLVTGEPIALPALFSTGKPPRLPVLDVRDERPVGKTVANLLLHPAMPAARTRSALVEASSQTLASHAISEAERTALASGDFASVLDAREAHVSSVCRRFFRSHAEFDTDDSPPLDSLVVEDS